MHRRVREDGSKLVIDFGTATPALEILNYLRSGVKEDGVIESPSAHVEYVELYSYRWDVTLQA